MIAPPAVDRQSTILGVVILLQAVAGLFFLGDAAWDVLEEGASLTRPAMLIECFAALSLAVALIIEGRVLQALLRRKAQAERGLEIARGALGDLMERNFQAWHLTPSEREVATFLIKGLSIAEIASLRGSAEGTIKAHLNGVYRKSGTSGRGGLLAILIEDLMAEPLIGR